MAESERSKAQQSRWRGAFEVSTTLAMLALAAILVWQGQSRIRRSVPDDVPIQLPRDPVAISSGPILGSRSAPIALIVYSDFKCPYSRRFAKNTLPALIKAYVDTTKVLIAFKHLPLEIHPDAPAAAAAAFCAGEQQQFWRAHDAIFAQPSKFTEADVRSSLGGLGLDLSAYDRCLSGRAGVARIEGDTAEARTLGITATPTSLVGKVQLDGRVRVTDAVKGAQPLEELKRILDRLLAS